jgi:cobalt-zinc-cadmium efflux system outer membrane protein
VQTSGFALVSKPAKTTLDPPEDDLNCADESGAEAVLRLPAALGLALALAALPVAARAAESISAPPSIPSPLALEQALEIFRAHGFDLLLADAAVSSAEGDLAIASAFQNPAVGASSGHTFTYDTNHCADHGCSDTPWTASLSDQGLVTDLVIGKRRLRRDAAEAALRAARLQRADAARTLDALLEQQWVQTVVAGALLRTAQQAAAASAQTSQLVDLRWHAGDLSEADAARAETAKLEADQSVDETRRQLEEAKSQLAFLLGERSGHPEFEVAPELPSCVAPATLADATPQDLLARARQRRADVAAARAQLEAAEHSLALAKRSRIPDISLNAGYQQEGHGDSAIQPPTATLGVSLPLPLFYRGQGEIEKAEAGVRAQRIAADKLDAQLSSEVSQAYAAWQSARSRVERMQGRMLERSQRALDLVDYQYKRGAASLLELLDAQRTWVSTQAAYQQNVGDCWIALYQLEAASGEGSTS